MRISDWSSDVCSSDLDPAPASTPINAQAATCQDEMVTPPIYGKMGVPPIMSGRSAAATIEAIATGRKLRGFHSNSSSSTASRMDAIGVPNTAVMPAAAPATNRVLRSDELMFSDWANSEPIAPPVMMIGPSAPNGPPVHLEIADESGLRSEEHTSELQSLMRHSYAVFFL